MGIRRRRRTLSVLFITLLTALGVIGSAAPASAAPSGFYKVSYSGDIYYYSDAFSDSFKLTYADWLDYGRPNPTWIGSDFVRYPWSDQIYAVTYFDTTRPESWAWQLLDFKQWRQAGSPTPHNAGWIDGSIYFRWATNDELFVSLNGQVHKLSFEEWAASGYQQPEVEADQGYMKLSWDSGIAKMYQIGAGVGSRISYDDWRNAGFPTPQVRSSLPGDRVCYSSGSDLYYEGQSFWGVLSFSQWAATGFMRPQYCW